MNLDPRSVEAELIEFYDEEAEERALRPLGSERLAARQRFIEELPRKTRALLEIGTGAGRDIRALAATGLEVVGVDLSIAQARLAKAAGALQAVASVRQLPFRDSSFDAVWTMSTLMHIPNSAISNALGELRRVLSPRAVAAIGVWGGPDIEDYGGHPNAGRLFSRRSDDTWRRLLNEFGEIQEYQKWYEHQDDFWYQWALVRVG